MTRRPRTADRRRPARGHSGRRAPTRAILTIVGIAALITSALIEWLKPYFGLNEPTVFMAIDIAVLAVSAVLLVLGEQLAAIRRSAPAQRSARLAWAISGVVGFLLALAVVVPHLSHGPETEGWLAFGGALLIAGTAALASRQR